MISRSKICSYLFIGLFIVMSQKYFEAITKDAQEIQTLMIWI